MKRLSCGTGPPVRAGSVSAAVLLIVAACATNPVAPAGKQRPCSADQLPSFTATPAVSDRLNGLADTITDIPADAKNPAVYRYSAVRTQLWTTAAGSVTPSEITSWRAADGSGRIDQRTLPARPDPDKFPDATERARLATAPATTTKYPRADGTAIAGVVTEPVPAHPDALAEAINAGTPTRCEPAVLVRGFVRLARTHYLNRAARSAALRMLAGIPSLAYDGIARDLAGRTGWSFSLSDDTSRQTILLDPGTGTLLVACASSLAATPQLLNYQLILSTDRTSTPDQPPDQQR